ncbi:PREDICTED: uncharacterized protein LOC104606151 [Nelumbo nucifera]|uniref:Uncharacterized protein LOC104606151 n=2 Tax=Nelumbo nucifera TaxID=4432 RepID=A0A1U8ANZ7_NELNU|nr:PREDICTED: uncharacterized protein LOC104606151 [Nelumbo nucifera]XP_010269521.1 PREDICTED: uncharacterized protein LOC104606151 [Nelumbo nucifera]DAD33316.1 TPA_asm: hypothetical protein HUJ06_012167 [Nelumbo nucifera]
MSTDYCAPPRPRRLAMAWAQYALSFHSSPSVVHRTGIIVNGRALALASASSPTPSKLTKRKNYLRPKLLKTLTKSHPTPLLPHEALENPRSITETVENLQHLCETLEIVHEQELEIYSDRSLGEVFGDIVEEVNEKNDTQKELDSEGLNVSQIADNGVSGGVGVISSRSVLELAFYVVGLFVLQTICAVWVLGPTSFGRETTNGEEEAEAARLGVSESEVRNGKRMEGYSLNRNNGVLENLFGSKPSSVIHIDKSQILEKIVEIRAMAKEARESEARELRASGLASSSDVIGDGADSVPAETASSTVKTNIQKEVDGRIFKLQKRLHSLRENSPLASFSYLTSSDKVKDMTNSEASNANKKSGNFVFKKKRRFRSSPSSPGNNPQGFQGPKDNSVPTGIGRKVATIDPLSNALDLSGGEQKIDITNGASQESTSMNIEKMHYNALGETIHEVKENKEARREPFNNESSSMQSVRKKLENSRREMAMGIENSKTMKGDIQEINCKRSVESAQLSESARPKRQISRSFTKENKDTSTITYTKVPLNSSGSSRMLLQNGEIEQKRIVKNRPSDIENDLWSLNLPYVLAILLHRGSDREGRNGLYSLKINSQLEEESSSYTVVFEGRSDARNFCYLLETFFEDLGDFSANVVPLSIKELKEAVESRTMKVIFVRKGQLQLYAGQPLADVEMALRSIIE